MITLKTKLDTLRTRVDESGFGALNLQVDSKDQGAQGQHKKGEATAPTAQKRQNGVHDPNYMSPTLINTILKPYKPNVADLTL